MNGNDEPFEKLCLRQIEGIASESERADLARMLRESESARRAYLDQMQVHAMLAWQHGQSAAKTKEVPVSAKPIRHWRWVGLAAAAAVVLVAGLLAWQHAKRPAGIEVEILATTNPSFRTGERVTLRNIDLESGSLSFRVSSGAVVDVSGPSQIELISAMHLRLLRGNVTADIHEGIKGFVIDTAEARVIDLGTRFGVTTNGTVGTEVAVFEGKVEVYDPDGKTDATSKPMATLTEGEAINIDLTKKPKPLKMIRLGDDARSIRSGAGSDIVRAVTDNLEDPDSRRFYGLLPGGMGEGSQVYTTRSYRTWHAMPGEPFPVELVGSDVIRTVSSYRLDQFIEITLQVDKPCDLFVMADARAPTPDWLKRDFTDTGTQLQSGPWVTGDAPSKFTEAGHAFVPHTVWKRQITAPGLVKLGPSQTAARGSKPVMYGIAVKPIQ